MNNSDGYIQIDGKRFLSPHSRCLRPGGHCPMIRHNLCRCENLQCHQQFFPILFRAGGRMLTDSEYRSYLMTGEVPEVVCLT